jgi:hypothetical protein
LYVAKGSSEAQKPDPQLNRWQMGDQANVLKEKGIGWL